MEDNFTENNFEEFLKEQVKNHRMYPNDSVWRDIYKKLHGDKRWPALTIAALTILSATIAVSVYFTPKPDIFTTNPANKELKNSTFLNSHHDIGLNNVTPVTPPRKEKMLLPAADKKELFSAVENEMANDGNKIVSGKKKELTEQSNTAIAIKKTNARPETQAAQQPDHSAEALHSVIQTIEARDVNLSAYPKTIITPDIVKQPGKNVKVGGDFNDKNMVDNFFKDHKDDIGIHTVPKTKSVKNKFGFQVYIAPSVSYRKLLEDRSVLKEGANPGPVGLNYVADVNKVVRHRPGNGLEAGFSILYYLSDHFRIKSGFQFNVRQYSIEAYRSGAELASIALVENNRIDTVNTIAIYRNSNGYSSAELVNRYYQLSVPVGLEWEIIGNKRIQFNVAGSIQPTYLINHNAYLLSTNFKNYSENPNLVRSFNINSNIETYISFRAGDFKWQIGPQLRYQPYSTFVPQYPIKEHLMDYGIKVGLSKTF